MRILSFLLALVFLLCGVPAEAEGGVQIPNEERLFDGDHFESLTVPAGAVLALEKTGGIGSVYFIFDLEYEKLTLADDLGAERVISVDGILHKFVDVQSLFGYAPEKMTVEFSDGEAKLNEVCIFAPGEVPDWVQKWERLPEGEADLLLLSTHGDDEQLFFAGLLPWYGAEQGKRVQVAYFTDHRNMMSRRVHEMLNGLWNVGIRYYPVFGPYPDYYTFDLQDAYRFYRENGSPEEELTAYVTGLLRRFRPQVVVGHDVAGEYGHGMHQLYTDLLCKALPLAPDPEAFPGQAAEYGLWDVPKTYLHLYPENPVTMDWDIPMAAFDGKTAYEVTRDLGFPAHISQQRDFAWYFRGADKAADVEKYSPCRYGLYRTTVGEDTGKNDFFENIPTEPPTESIPEPEEILAETTFFESEIQTFPTEKSWPLIPAVGTLVLLLLIFCLSSPIQKEN